MKSFSCLMIASILFSLTSYSQLFGPKKIIFPDAKLSQFQVCGANKCEPGNYGIPFVFREYYAPDIANVNDEKSIAIQLLGHSYPESSLRGDLALFCSPDGASSPFTMNDIKPMGFTGRDIKYDRSEKLNINVEAATKANIDQLKQFTGDSSKLKKLEIQIKAAYARIAGKTLKVGGTYYEYGLDQSTLNQLIQNQKYKACKDYLKAHDLRLITAIGFVKFDISYESTSLDSLASEIQSAISKEGIQAQLAFTFKKQVSQSLKASTSNLYSIVAWRSANSDEIDAILNPK